MKTVEGKCVILGAQGVGKTSVVTRYVYKNYNSYLSPTIAASFFRCNIFVDNINVKIQVWDTAGQERFKSMAPMYYRNAKVAILVFDITCLYSFDNVKYWAKELKRMIDEPMVLCVVGNKIDLLDERKISRDEASQYSNSIGANYFESSALHDKGIEQIFLNIANGLIRLSGEKSTTFLKIFEGEIPADSALHITEDGKTETASWSIHSIAHANSEKPMCC